GLVHSPRQTSGAVLRSPTHSNSGTGISPGSSPLPATITPPSRASHSTPRTSSAVDAPLITYCRIVSGLHVAFTSAMVRKASITLRLSALNSVGTFAALSAHHAEV